MASLRSALILSAAAIAFGGIAGAVSVALRGPAPMAPPAPPVTVRPSVQTEDAVGDDTPTRHARDRATTRSLSARIDADDDDTRYRVAIELLRRGPDALPQVRALRPRSAEARELVHAMTLALQTLRDNARMTDHAKLSPSLRLQLRLQEFRRVVPEEYLVDERRSYWESRLAVESTRRDKGFGHEGELALAEVELARVQREMGELSSGDYAQVAAARLPVAWEWVDSLRGRRGVAIGTVQRYEEQLARLEP